MSCIHQNAEVILEAFIARIRTAETFKEIKNVQIYQNTLNAQGDITKYRKVLEEIFKETYPALKNVEDIFIVEENTSSLALNISPEFSKVYEDIFTNKLLKEKAEYDKKGYKNGNFIIFKNIDTVPFLLATDEFRALQGQSFRHSSGRVTKEFVRDYSNSSAALEKLRRKFGRSNVEYSKTFKDGMYVNKVQVYSPVLETYTSSNKQLSLFLSPEVKEGVSELFESNLELANAVYEALGFSKESDFKQTFKSSLWRGQESQPFIDENGNLVLTPTYDSLFKSEGISFAEHLSMAQGYGERYSKNPFIIEIDESYADSIYPLDREGRSRDYGKRVVGDEREQRFVAKDDIVIPKGKFKIHKQKLNLNLSDVKTSVLLRKYQEQFTEIDVAEHLRYGEIAKGYATEDPLVFEQVEQELLKRGITKKDLPFLIQNRLNSLEYNVAEALGITKEFTDNFLGKKINLPDESSVTQKDIDFYLSKVEEVENKLENKGTRNEIGSKNNTQPTPQQKQQAQQIYSEYLSQNPNGSVEGFKSWVDSNLANQIYEALGYGTSIIQDNKSYYRGQIEKPTIDKNGNLVLHAKEDELYKKAGLKSKGVSMTDDLQSAIEYGNGQLDVSKNLASEENVGVDLERELDRLDENGYYLIQIPKNISNEIVKEAGEVKVIGDKIVIPKGQYKIEQVIDGVDTEITPEQKQEAQQLYGSYLQTTNNPTIEGFKQWNNRQQQINELFESNPTLANEVYEAAGFKSNIILPNYKIDRNLKNKDGSKRLAQSGKNGITLNPVESIKEFFDYFTGKEGGITSQQKNKVILKLEKNGYPLNKIKSILNTKKRINTFLILHEQNHIDNNDIDVYWKSGRDLLTDDKIEIETRATLSALKQLENEITPQQKREAQQLYSNFLDKFVKRNFDKLVSEMESKNLIEKKCD